MSVRIDRDKHGQKRVVCDHRWPDGKRYRRVMQNRATAKQVDARIAAAIATGTWRELRLELEYGQKLDFAIREFGEYYFEVYCKVRNKETSWKRKRSSLRHINRHLGRIRLGELTLSHVHKFIAKRLQEGVTPTTVNRDLAVLRHLYEFALDEKAVEQTPVGRLKMLQERREERPRVAPGDLERLLEHLSFPVKQLVVFIYETGCRPSEAMRLKWEHVDLDAQVAIFNLRKAGDNALVGPHLSRRRGHEGGAATRAMPVRVLEPENRDTVSADQSDVQPRAAESGARLAPTQRLPASSGDHHRGKRPAATRGPGPARALLHQDNRTILCSFLPRIRHHQST